MKKLVVDIETYDPGLTDWGPSIIRGGGKILYVSTYDGTAFNTYGDSQGLTWKHPTLVQQLADPNIEKIFHNGLYDMNWFVNWAGLTINGRTRDTMTRETLLDAYCKYYTKEQGQGYSLNSCCLHHNITGKNKLGTIDEWWRSAGFKGKAIEHLQEIPKEIVTAYVEQDVKATWDLFWAQQPALENEELLSTEELDDEMVSLALLMYKNGVRIDEEGRDRLAIQVQDELWALGRELEEKYGITKPGSRLELARAFEKENLIDHLALTDKGKPSFGKDSVKGLNHELGHLLGRYKGKEKLLGTYLMGQYVDYCIDGRIHPLFHPSFGDDGGAKTGRWSCSNPNLQNVPKQVETGGNEVRPLFIANEGQQFCKFDYSQIEYVILSHYAIGIQAPGWQALKEKMEAGVKYHKIVQSMLGWDNSVYTLVKAKNFGVIYGMGVRSFADKFYDLNLEAATKCGKTVLQYCEDIDREYHKFAPFIKPTTQWIIESANKMGYVRSFGGRKHRLPPKQYNPRTQKMEVATYKLVNYLIQGGASEIFKKALVKTKRSGIWNELELNMVVHDEVDYNSSGSKNALEAEKELKRCMVTAQELMVPIRVEGYRGLSWKESEE